MNITREELISHLKENEILKTQRIIDAFATVDRADFVPPEYRDDAYGDFPLPIGFGATISQPTVVAFMLELLQPRKGDKVLDVGTGSGWTTALLAHIIGPSGSIAGIEIIPELVALGTANLKKYNLPQASIAQAKEGVFGIPEKAPFDKILVSAAAEELPNESISQLAAGGPPAGEAGRMVIPVRDSVWKIDKKKDGTITKEEFYGFSFVPLQR